MNLRLGAVVPGPDTDGESGIDGIPDVICPGVTSSTRLSQSFVLRFLKTFAAELDCNREVLSCLKLCSSATTRIDFLCLARLSAALPLYGSGAGGYSTAVGDVPPELASMTGLSTSWSGKKTSSLSSTSSGLGRDAHEESWNVLSDLDGLLFGCRAVGVRAPRCGRGGDGGGCLGGGGNLLGMIVSPPPLLPELFICDACIGNPLDCSSILTVRGGPRLVDFNRSARESSSIIGFCQRVPASLSAPSWSEGWLSGDKGV